MTQTRQMRTSEYNAGEEKPDAARLGIEEVLAGLANARAKT